MSELYYLEMLELSVLIRSRKISPVEVTEAMIARIEALDGRLHSYATKSFEMARAQAKRAEDELMQGQCRSPLHGIPLAYKDLFDTQGVATACGMPIHQHRIPRHNATVVERLEDAGVVMLGKLQMTEGAFAIHHPSIIEPINPWGAAHWAGASSSGCGVATAAGLCFASLGTDTGGSIRFPSAANGLTGLKPTWGRVSRHGAFELAASLDHVGPMTRSAKDALFLLSTIAGFDPKDPTSLASVCLEIPGIEESFKGLRVGIDERWISEGVDGQIVHALERVMALVVQGGGQLVRVTVPDTLGVSRNWEAHCGVQTALAHQASYPARAAEYGPALSRLIEGGLSVSGLGYQRILKEAMAFSGAMEALLKDVDVLLAPVQPYAAPTHTELANLAADAEANVRLIQFTAPFNVTGQPALSLPIGFSAQGMPLGGQLIARKGAEAVLCRAGMALQKLSDWHKQRPLS